jgi:hypothetical protein
MQVVTNENIQELIQNRSVPAYVPPKADAPKSEAAPIENKDSIDIANDTKKEQPRGDDGKFLKETEGDTKVKEAAKTAVDGDEDDADLPERVRRQIGKKHRAMKEAEEFARERDREAAVAEARAADLERRLTALEGSKSGPAQDKKREEGAPKPEDFKTVAEYADALVEFKMEQKLQKTRQEALQKNQESAEAQAQSEFIKRLEKDRAEIENYDEVVAEADVIVPAHVAQYIAECERPGVLGYHLAKNPEVLERLSKLSPIRAVAELGKLEGQLEKKPEPKAQATPAVSRAPSPIVPLEGNKTTVTTDPSKMSFQELRAFRQAERASGKR